MHMALVKMIISEIRLVDMSVLYPKHTVIFLSTKIRPFMRTEEDTKQQLDENFKWYHK